MPDELDQVLSEPSDQPIRLTSQNASDYVDLLWPLGLANRMAANFNSPLIGKSLSNFASTAGWTLGEQQNGGAYFSKYPIVEMTPLAEALAVRVAKSTFRPCCGNSTFFFIGIRREGIVLYELDEEPLTNPGPTKPADAFR